MEANPQYYGPRVVRSPMYAGKKRPNATVVVALCFSLLALILLAVAVGTPSWYVFRERTFFGDRIGLWYACRNAECVFNDWGIIVRVLLVTPLFFLLISIILMSVALCRKSPRCCAGWAGALLIVASLSFTAGTIMYWIGTAFGSASRATLGYSLWVSVAGNILMFIAGILSCIGACVESSEDVIIVPAR